nr:MAG TPA: hypothetical protein [Caudoviricetes sp.]
MKRWQRGKSRSAARWSPSLPLPEWEAGSIPAGGFPCFRRARNLLLTERERFAMAAPFSVPPCTPRGYCEGVTQRRLPRA